MNLFHLRNRICWPIYWKDLLQFASERLPVGGRLAFWMPTANDNFEETQIPQHERLELLHCLEQLFNQWSRRLLVYVKRDESYKGITSNGLKEKTSEISG